MQIDGRHIASLIDEELKNKLSTMEYVPSVALLYIGSDTTIESYINIKKKVASQIGISVVEYRLSHETTTVDVVEFLNSIAHEHEGLVVQLPLPPHIDRSIVLNSIPLSKDIDVLSDSSFVLFCTEKGSCIPPVAGAVQEIIRYHNINTLDLTIAVVGKGKLVGIPVLELCKHIGCAQLHSFSNVQEIDREFISRADLIVSGTGEAWSIVPEMIKEGVILIDAGTSVEAGVSKGDIHPDSYAKASLFTPVPGGVGPITVRILFKNILTLLSV
jgi:methylenetetrahydrofolate dehydrogenase (NADP+)/methenyltetrahydrofolate cyclohydrolase